MIPKISISITSALILCLAVSSAALAKQPKTPEEIKGAGEWVFTTKVYPILKAKCLACHGEDPKGKIKGGFDMRTRAGLLAGGDSGDPSIVPGDPEKSSLYHAVLWRNEDLQMPPKENDKLTIAQARSIHYWIKLGAYWPDETRRKQIMKWALKNQKGDGLVIKTQGGLSDEWSYRRYKKDDVWAWLPLKQVKPSKVAKANHPVDAFIRAKLAAARLKPAPKADKLTLIRRATFDLTGLPPTPKEIESFVNDKSPNALEKLVDRLLASKHYGERWAQHWLDVVRYADTSGFSNDFERSNAWRFRDYVIRSFNNDKPFDRFIKEQVAGEELDPKDPEMIIAQGFLRMGPWEHTAMSPKVVSRQRYLDDVVNSVGQTFLATPLRCAKCHDHKFDPIPTSDYYRIYSAFSTTQPVERTANYLPEESRSEFAANRKHVEELLAFAKEKLDVLYAKREAAAKKWYADRGRANEYKPWEQRRRSKSDDKPPRFVGLTTEEEGRVKVREQDVRIWTRRLERYEPLAQSVYSAGEFIQGSTKLRMNNKAKSMKVPVNHILAGGSIHSKSTVVTPGVLSGLNIPTFTGNNKDPYALPNNMSGRRLPLAKWIADRRNGLTWRTIVNRIWHYHFGRGIAGNPNNFGATGKKPTHPQLLDWLAGEFIKQRGSFKKMHRLIMTSQTYQQASHHPDIERLKNEDPTNQLLAVHEPRRLTAEELRDSMLAITGELNREMGGLPIFPEINMEVALSPRMIQFSLAPAYQPSRTSQQRNRRSIYAYRTRGLRDPMMEVFNKPGADESCEARDAPTVTPQVFTMLNGDVVTKRSIAFALRLEGYAKHLPVRISKGFKLAFGRAPRKGELAGLQDHYLKMVKYHTNNPPKPEKYPTRVTRSLVEEFSGQPFKYEERLNVYENYVADKHAWDVSAETRALADVCLLLFNANEFMYVY